MKKKDEIRGRSLAGIILSLLIVFVVSFFRVSAQSPRQKNVGPEEYQVYDVVLLHMFAGGEVTFDTGAKVKQLVIRDETNTEYAWSSDKENWEQVKRRLRDVSDETIAGYEAARTPTAKLSRSFASTIPYSLFQQNEYESIFGKTKNNDGTTETWHRFYEKFPDSGGYVWLSNVGFNKARDRALVYFVHWCGDLCGTGQYIHLIKTENKWKVGMVGRIWIS